MESNQTVAFADEYFWQNRKGEKLETALKITEDTGDEVSGYLIERALDQTRADAWPNAIDDAPASH